MQLAPFVVCPETLGPLEPVEGGFRSPLADRVYPVSRQMVFMGYPERDDQMIRATMEEEHEWQGTGAAAEANLAFLRYSAPRAVDLINLARRFTPADLDQPRALELGSGNGWVSWLLAEAGFDTWLCDFEANSLATGLNLSHPRLGEGKRFVVDARYAPFASGCMDLVLFKEFVHHVGDYRRLFLEANRILKPGGLMVLLEPTRDLRMALNELRHPDPHLGHHITWLDAYLHAIRRSGFEELYRGYVYASNYFRRPAMKRMRDRANQAIDGDRPFGDWFTKVHTRLLGGGELVVVARKAEEAPSASRPAMMQIDPTTLTIEDDELAAYSAFPDVLREAAIGLTSRS